LKHSSYRSIGGFLVYDVTDRKSFENISEWLIEVEDYANEYLIMCLIGNKIDLEKE